MSLWSPILKASGEHKSKPTQHSVKELQGLGIAPDIIVLRCDEPITDLEIFRKIANFCNVKPDCVIENLTLPILYEAPLFGTVESVRSGLPGAVAVHARAGSARVAGDGCCHQKAAADR